MKIASTARDATVFVARIPLGAGRLLVKGIPSPVSRTVGKVIGTVDVLRPHHHVSTDAGAPVPEAEPAEAAGDSPKPHGDPVRPDAPTEEVADPAESPDERSDEADSPKPHGDPLRPVPSDTGADAEAAEATDTTESTDAADTADAAEVPDMADIVDAADAAVAAEMVDATDDATAPAEEFTPADMPGAKNKPDTRPTAAQVAAEEQTEVTTPVGTTGADVAHNPDTAETDLQQPGTEPLLDPSTTKRIAKEAETLGKAADSKKG